MIRAASRRTMGAWMEGPRDVRHADTVELCFLTSGELPTHLDGRAFRVRAGEVSLIPAGVVHSSWTEGHPIEELVVHLDAAVVAARVGVLTAGIRPFDGSELRQAQRAVAGDDVSEALVAVVRAFGSEAGGLDDPRLRRVVEAVSDALAERWTVARLAAVAGMSPAHFSRSFHAAVGAPPLRWVQDRRLDRAARLMRSTELTLTDIAHGVGFRSSSRLTEAFQRRHGASPSVWRLRGTD